MGEVNNILLLERETEEQRQSPELRYLRSLNLLEVRRAFSRVRVDNPEASGLYPTPPTDVDAVLVMGPDPILVRCESLAHMRRGLERGIEICVPYRLDAVESLHRTPVYTLRGYELLEHQFLEAGPWQVAPGSSPFPLSLLTPPVYDRLLARRRVGRVENIHDSDGLDTGEGALGHAGLYHRFVDYYGEARTDVLALFPDRVEEVLEIGCGRGVTARLLQERYGCRVTGVELNPVVAREAAEHLHRVVVGDVTRIEVTGPFDVILATEVIEHIPEPEPLLAHLRKILRPGGRMILSVPNVGHYSVVEDLLAGRWDYLPIGLLCYTHYRFFTRRTLEDWLHRIPLDHFEIIPQETELPRRMAELPGLTTDRESLRTKGFYVVVQA